MITIVTLTTLTVTALLVALAVVSLLPDEEPLPDAETHDSEPQRDPWAPVSTVTVENFGRGSLPARVITTHQERVYDLYGKHEQH